MAFSTQEIQKEWDLGTKYLSAEIPNAQFSGLHRLSLELLNNIADHLTPLSLACLRNICRRFYYCYNHAVVLGCLNKFELLCMLEHDQPNLERLICGECRATHH